MKARSWLRATARISRAKALGKPTQRGFTLIEVTIAALLLLVATAGIVPFFLSSLAQGSTVRYKSIATNIARERLEEIRQLDYREIESASQLAARLGVSETQRGIPFMISYGVNESTYQEGVLKEVTVNVSWTGPPEPSTASLTTMVHQQYLGPRGSLLGVWDQSGYPYDRVPGTPFWLVSDWAFIHYHIAEADWGLIFSDLEHPSTSVRDVYARFALFDDSGNSIPLGPAADDYKLDTSYLSYTLDTDGTPLDVWFRWTVNTNTIPDGYWELHAVAYNVYDQPGNTWRIRMRIENGSPAVPTAFVAIAEEDNETVNLYWAPGAERDRAYFVLERSTNGGAYETLAAQLDADATEYLDQGSVADETHPWGSPSLQNYYTYRLHAVDDYWDGAHSGPEALASTYVPSATTTTTLETTTTTLETTTTTSSTTTTTGPTTYWVQIENGTNKNYSITIKNASDVTVFTGTAAKNSVLTVNNLPVGNFQITARSSGRPTLYQSFSLEDDRYTIVMTIL